MIINYCQYIYPYRGFLLQLIPVGCGVPPSTSRAKLIHFNSSHAEFRCREREEVFSDSLLAVTTLLCVGNTYHKPLSPCIR